MATDTNPVQQLAALINQLYDLSNDPALTDQQRKDTTLRAHDLRGSLVELVTQRLSADDAGYQDLMKNVAAATAALNATEQTIQKMVQAVATAADVAAAVDNLLDQALALGQTAAKLAVA